MNDGHLYYICDGHLLHLMTSYPVFKKAGKDAGLTQKKCGSVSKNLLMFTQHPRVKNRSKQVDRDIKVAWKSSFELERSKPNQ